MRSSAYTNPTIFFVSLVLIVLSTACSPISPSSPPAPHINSSEVEAAAPTVKEQVATLKPTVEIRPTRSSTPIPPTVSPTPPQAEAVRPAATETAQATDTRSLLPAREATLPLLDPGEVTPRPSITNTLSPTPTVEPTFTPTRFAGVRIQTVGDSITEGGMYRLPLISLLNSTGCRYDMVGSRETGWAKGWDGDHQGYGGATAYWLVDDGIGLGQEMSNAFALYRPDIVLLHIGTNDLWNTDRDPFTISEYVRTLIFKIRAGRADTDIYLAQIIPGQPFDVTEYNRQLQRIAQEMSTAGSPVILVDMTSNFDPNSDTSDGVHPNGNGGQKMALSWFNAMQANGWCNAGG